MLAKLLITSLKKFTINGMNFGKKLWLLAKPTRQTDILQNFKKAVDRGCSVKKMFLKISQILQENTCVRVPS